MTEQASTSTVQRERAETTLSGSKRVAFSLAMLLIPVLFFVVLEGGLRVAGYGDDYPLFVPVQGHPAYRYQSRDVARRYFTHIHDVPSSLRDFFRAEKAPGTLRVVVQGGSSAAGFPFYYGGSFSRMLEDRLAKTFPDRPVEVINTSMAAVNSYTLLDLADEIVAVEPDAVLIYAGHNEYYGALGVGSSESFSGMPALTRLYLRLRTLRTVQLLRAALGRAAGLFAGRTEGERPSGTMMERMVGEQTIPYGSALYEQGLEQFRSNLDALLARYEDAGIPVFIGTLVSNERDQKPFISHVPASGREAWETAFRRGLDAAQQGRPDGALSALDEAIAMDSLSADAYFARGRVLERMGRPEEARTAYLAAKDRDELRFRAPEAMNAVVRAAAERHGAQVVDTRRALAEASPNGIVGSSLLIEHLHPNVDGYFVLADAFYDALRSSPVASGGGRTVTDDEARAALLLTPVDSLVGTFRIRTLMAGWPFQPPGTVDRSLLALPDSTPLQRIAVDLFRDETSWVEALRAQRTYFERQGAYARALQMGRAYAREYPFLAEPYLWIGNALMQQERYDEALEALDASIEREETPPALTLAGSILLQRGDRDRAVDYLERALRLDPNNQQALYNLAGAYALGGRYAEARRTVERLLEVAPEHAAGRRLLASLPAAPATEHRP